jgi:hypothetical protein
LVFLQVVPSQTLIVPVTKADPLQTLARPDTKAVPFQTLAALITVIVKVPVLVDPVTLVALSTKVKVPGVVGVPVIAPVEVFRLSPPGKAPENTE